MKKTLALLAAGASIGAPLSQAAVISLTPDYDTTTTPLSSQGPETQQLPALTNDPFAYDPLDPTAALPAGYSPGTGFHGDTGITDTIAFDFDDSYNNLFIDLYGRRAVAPERDDSFDIQFFLGNTLQETVTGGIPDNNTATTTGHGRFTASVGTVADSFRIVETGTDTSLTFLELRVNGVAIPEPSSTALLGLGGLALLLRRRK